MFAQSPQVAQASKDDSAAKVASTPADDDAFSMLDDLRIEENTPAQERAKYIKDLYEGDPTCQCCSQWVQDVPADLDDEDSEEEDEGAPLVVRRRRTHGGKKAWEIACIEIKSATLKDVLLSKVFSDFTLLGGLKHLTLLAPFRDLYYNADKLEMAIKDEKDETTLNGLRILRHLVRPKYAADAKVAQELISSGIISNNLLWMLFRPGELIYTKVQGQGQLLHLTQVHVAGQVTLEGRYVGWDGHRFGYIDKHIALEYFSGTKNINQLQAFPARFLPDLEGVKQRMLERGRKYQSLAGIHAKSYVDENEDGNGSGPRIERRIIVDNKSNPDRTPQSQLLSLWNKLTVESALIQQQPFRASNLPPNGIHIALEAKKRRGAAHPASNNFGGFGAPYGYPPPPPPPGNGLFARSNLGPHKLKLPMDAPDEHVKSDGADAKLTAEQLMLCSHKVKGYCLRDRHWRKFSVDSIHDIQWDDAPFDSLVLPDGYKDLILAFVESQLKQNDRFDDVINGKGGGLVILLAGEPGVGKTLTAESVAEKIKAPLYKMELAEEEALNDLPQQQPAPGVFGNNAVPHTPTGPHYSTIEQQFEHATNWDAVMLLDECDAYLSKRNGVDARQKRILNKFLQKLEYFPSLLFLTTNHAEALDPALASRVHLTINYPALNEVSRLAIWRNFLDRADPPAALSWEEIEKLSQLDLNGRRIKNVVKTAQIMARREHRAVRLDDIRKVMTITEGLKFE